MINNASLFVVRLYHAKALNLEIKSAKWWKFKKAACAKPGRFG